MPDRRSYRITYELEFAEGRPRSVSVLVGSISRAAANKIAEATSSSPMDRVKLGEIWVPPGDIRSWSVSSRGV
jgi:hypothetical protein